MMTRRSPSHAARAVFALSLLALVLARARPALAGDPDPCSGHTCVNLEGWCASPDTKCQCTGPGTTAWPTTCSAMESCYHNPEQTLATCYYQVGQSSGACSCPNGVQYDGTPVTGSCGQLVCAGGGAFYLCGESGWTPIYHVCGADGNYEFCGAQGPYSEGVACQPWLTGGAGGGGGSGGQGGSGGGGACSCWGTDYNHQPVTVDCGVTVCGEDFHNYYCISDGNWQFQGGDCPGGGGGSGGGGGAGGGGACTCSGADYNQAPVTVACGETVCGMDFHNYVCASDGNWQFLGGDCPGGSGGSGGAGGGGGSGDGGSSCACTDGMDYLGKPVSVDCGQSVCGLDFQTYLCNDSGNWEGMGASCGGGNGGNATCPGSGFYCSSWMIDADPNTLYFCLYGGVQPLFSAPCGDGAECIQGPPGTGAYCQPTPGTGGSSGSGGSGGSGGGGGTGGGLSGLTCQGPGQHCGGAYVPGGDVSSLYQCESAGAEPASVESCSLGCFHGSGSNDDFCVGGGGDQGSCELQPNGTCPTSDACYKYKQEHGSDPDHFTLHVCGSQILGPMDDFPDAQGNAIVPDNLYVCGKDRKGLPPTPLMACTAQNKGCRSRNARTYFPTYDDYCCQPGTYLCNTAGAGPVCWGQGDFCGDNLELMQGGVRGTRYHCAGSNQSPGATHACATDCQTRTNGKGACVPQCNAPGIFCGSEVLEGEDDTQYYCHEAGERNPLAVHCQAGCTGCASVPFCKDVTPGAYCSSDTAAIVDGAPNTLYQCTRPWSKAVQIKDCGAAGCGSHSIVGRDSCNLPVTCPNIDYTVYPGGAAHFCGGHVIEGDPDTLYSCSSGGPPTVDPSLNPTMLSTPYPGPGSLATTRICDQGCIPQFGQNATVPGYPDPTKYNPLTSLQDACAGAVAPPPKNVNLPPICKTDIVGDVCGKNGVELGDPDTLYHCTGKNQPASLVKACSGAQTCLVHSLSSAYPGVDDCGGSNDPAPLLCVNPRGGAGYYCSGDMVQGGLPSINYYCPYPATTSYPALPIQPLPLGAQPSNGQVGSYDCLSVTPTGVTANDACLVFPGHDDFCNMPKPIDASTWRWWNAATDAAKTQVYQPRDGSAPTRYDVDISTTAMRKDKDEGIPVVLRHAAWFRGTIVDKNHQAPWGFAPRVFDLTTHSEITFYHLRPDSVHIRDDLPINTPLPEGTLLGMAGGGPQDPGTGYPDYSTAPHLCVQYDIVPSPPRSETALERWDEVIGPHD